MISHQNRLTFEQYALLTESAPELGGKLQEWHDFYIPATPGECEYLDMSVMSSIQRRRVLQCQTEILNQHIRTAVYNLDCAMDDEVRRYRDMLPTQPAAAVVGLKRSAPGLRFLIQRWERLLRLLAEEETWYGSDRDEAIHYLGAKAGKPENLFGSEGAYLTWVYCVMTQTDAKDKDFIDLGQEQVMPKSIQDRKPEHWLPMRDHCLMLLIELANRELAALRPRAEYLRLTIEEPARDGAEIAKQVLAGPEGALLLRHLRTHESHFHRAYQAFLKGRKETARTGLLPGQPIAHIHGAPNETPAQDQPEPGPEAVVVPVQQAQAARKQGANTVAPGADNGIGASAASDIYRAAVVATGFTPPPRQTEEDARVKAEAPQNTPLATPPYQPWAMRTP
jgi:hypothetical protein